ncbi:hypothetical protein NQ318_020234 [Aromia moschata]|uniref:Transposase n=1 Tax=Aromia moschata TaxID=1265417 RepID=A0AAV8ZBI3_9CUCU|nr:hypothetical protein NQ318_020234 [Aromia moschata]
MFRPWENSKPSTNIHDDEENLNRTDDLLQEQGKKNYLCEKAQQIVMNVYRNTVASEGEKRGNRENVIFDRKSIHTDLRGNGFINVSQETVRKWILKIGFKFKVIDKRANVMESRRIVEWRMEAENRPIYYLDETWYDTHDTPRKGWTDGSKKCIVDLPSNKGTRLIILHCGSENGWVNNCLKLCGKKLEDSNVDYHRNMTSEIFEEWFKEILIPNLERNSCNHDKKDKKEQLLDLVKKSNFKKRYVIDELAKDHGHTLIWSQLKRAVRRNNTFPKFDKKVIDLIRTEVDKITPEKWKKCMEKVIEVENEYILLGQCLKNNGRLVIQIGGESDDSCSDSDLDDTYNIVDSDVILLSYINVVVG